MFPTQWLLNGLSAGTGAYHIGSPADSRSVRTCAKFGIGIDHRARQVTEEDFKKFDYLLAMDTENLDDLHAIAADFDNNERGRLGKGDCP